jgi:hypothetical protein
MRKFEKKIGPRTYTYKIGPKEHIILCIENYDNFKNIWRESCLERVVPHKENGPMKMMGPKEKMWLKKDRFEKR